MQAATAENIWPPKTLPADWRVVNNPRVSMVSLGSQDGRYMITYSPDSGGLYSLWDEIDPVGTAGDLEEVFRWVRARCPAPG